jgi:hypothetical protein
MVVCTRQVSGVVLIGWNLLSGMKGGQILGHSGGQGKEERQLSKRGRLLGDKENLCYAPTPDYSPPHGLPCSSVLGPISYPSIHGLLDS